MEPTESKKFLTASGLDVSKNSTETQTEQGGQRAAEILTAGLMTFDQRQQTVYIIGLMTQIFNASALVSNALSIVVFVRLGFAESSNISLLALTVTELTATVLSVWTCLCGLQTFQNVDLPFNPLTLPVLTGAGHWTFVVRCSAWITAFISFERCLCIVIPLKVKRLITPRTTSVIVIVIAVVTVAPSIGIFWRWRFVWLLSPTRNRTILDVAVVHRADVALMEATINVIYGVILPVLAFAIVAVCTVFLVVQLRRNSQWRKTAMSEKPAEPASGQRMSSKEERLVKMVTSFSIVFIVCYSPSAVMILGMAVSLEFSLFGRYQNIYFVTFVVGSLFQSVSASVNILIYYNMGSKFRNAFHEIFCISKKS